MSLDGVTGVFQAGLIVDGSTTDSDHYMWLSVPPSERHQGQAGNGVILDPAGLAHVIHLKDDYTHIEGLEITGWSGISVEAGNTLLENLLIHDDDAGGFANPDSDAIKLNGMTNTQSITIRNSIIYNIGRGAINYAGAVDIIVNIHNVNSYNPGLSAEADGEGGINNNSTTGTNETICPVPAVSPGNYFVLAFVDSAQVISELNEDNNTASSTPILVGNPLPTLTTLTPNTSPAGSADINITLDGSNFISSSAASFAGNSLATSFVSST